MRRRVGSNRKGGTTGHDEALIHLHKPPESNGFSRFETGRFFLRWTVEFFIERPRGRRADALLPPKKMIG